MSEPVGKAVEVRCTNHPTDTLPGWTCRKQVAIDFAGYLRTKCPKCHAQVKALTTGRTEIPDVDGVIVVTVTKEKRPA